MKRFILTLAVALIGVSSVAVAETPAERLQNQRARIQQGVRSGSLTRVEAQRLRKQEAGLRQQVRRDRIDGSGLTARERAKSQVHAKAVSRNIGRLKHNNRTR